jgi:hypothetical protein
MVQSVIAERRTNAERLTKNIDVHTHNTSVHAHNAKIAEARGDRALAERSRAGLREAETGLARTKAMIEAARVSEARLTEQLTQIEGQIETLRASSAP